MMRYKNIAMALFCLCISACNPFKPSIKPWERNILAKNEMAWTPDVLESGFRDHVYFSKEGSFGGGGIGGGGCGCN